MVTDLIGDEGIETDFALAIAGFGIRAPICQNLSVWSMDTERSEEGESNIRVVMS